MEESNPCHYNTLVFKTSCRPFSGTFHKCGWRFRKARLSINKS